MPKVTVTLSVMVTLDVPEELAEKVTREDLVDMARASTEGANGIGVVVDGECQEESGEPVFADVFMEHDTLSEPEIEFEDDGFTLAERAQRGVLGSA